MSETTAVQVIEKPQTEQKSDTKALISLYAKLARVAGQLTTFQKDARNTYHKYDYVSAAQVMEVIGRTMASEGIAFLPQIVQIEIDEKIYRVQYEYTFADTETGATITRRWWGEGAHTSGSGTRDDKALNKIATTTLKYFLLTTFVVSGSEEADIDAGESPSARSNGTRDDSEPSGETELVKEVDVRTYTRKNGTEKQYLVLDEVSIWSKEPFRQLGYLPTEIEMLTKVGKHELPDPVIIRWERNDRGYKDAVTITRPKTGEIVNVAEVYEAAKQRKQQDDDDATDTITVPPQTKSGTSTSSSNIKTETSSGTTKTKQEIEDDIPF